MVVWVLVVPGSSPRVRGKLVVSSDNPLIPRLIPACAGKTLSKPLTPFAARAHPRVCGENALSNVIQARRAGSSPRVRGKP